MSITVTLEEKTAQALEALRTQAADRGLSLEQYLKKLAENSDRVLGPALKSPHLMSSPEFAKWLEDLSAGMPKLPSLPADFSRADIYNDHD